MKERIVSNLAWLIVLALAAGVAAWAEDGRDFAGLFEARDPIASGADVILTFETELLNHSGEDVLGATVELTGTVHPQHVYATWNVVDIPAGGAVRLGRDLSVPSAEYDAWQRGQAPHLTIRFQDGAGNDRLHSAELVGTIFAEEPSQ